MNIVKKYWYVVLFASLSLLNLCDCNAMDAIDPANISVNDFSDGKDSREERYEAAF